VSRKAAQGFSGRGTWGTPQPETRGERRAAQKGPFMDGHYHINSSEIHYAKTKKTVKGNFFLDMCSCVH
jgi:hypothetical protein